MARQDAAGAGVGGRSNARAPIRRLALRYYARMASAGVVAWTLCALQHIRAGGHVYRYLMMKPRHAVPV